MKCDGCGNTPTFPRGKIHLCETCVEEISRARDYEQLTTQQLLAICRSDDDRFNGWEQIDADEDEDLCTWMYFQDGYVDGDMCIFVPGGVNRAA